VSEEGQNNQLWTTASACRGAAYIVDVSSNAAKPKVSTTIGPTCSAQFEAKGVLSSASATTRKKPLFSQCFLAAAGNARYPRLLKRRARHVGARTDSNKEGLIAPVSNLASRSKGMAVSALMAGGWTEKARLKMIRCETSPTHSKEVAC